ncbi:MAG: CAP domain-containing protein [Bacteroidia bacterium]|nr:CAP domain-containing protein [Bacteroidia bacterium]
MFRKTLKQLKIFFILIIALLCLPRSILPHQTSDFNKNDFENYLKLNESERKLVEFKDDEEALKLKLIQLEIINKSRKKSKASPVKLDILASRVANKMCREAAENNYVGHWNMAGEKPYHRYAFAGGYDHVSENAFGEWSSDNYNASGSNISSMMKSGHATFMAEKAPNNGHKKNIIDKSHNFVGIGFYLSGNQFRYYEEFIDRYLEFENIPAEVKTDEPCSITVKTNGQSFLYYLIVYREKFPQPLSPVQISKKGSYDDFTKEQYLIITAWDLAPYRSGSFYKIPFSFLKEGLYYIHIYSDKKEITKPSSLNTKGKTPESGIVIKVNN